MFTEFDPASDCDCPGCRRLRRVVPYSRTGHVAFRPAAHRALFVAAATAAGAALGAGQAAVAAPPQAPGLPGAPTVDGPDTPQGARAPLYGPADRPATLAAGTATPAISRSQVIERAKTWVAAKVPYSMSAYWSDGYRQDCSGYVSMAWNLPANEWTGSLGKYADRITKEQLRPGDILLFHNAADPQNGSHVVIFGGWTDAAHTAYTGYEQTRPRTRTQSTPYAYWSNSARYVPYRYKGITEDTEGSAGGTGGAPGKAPGAFPGASSFGPGATNPYVTELGRMLVARGAARYYTSGPGPRWGEADRRATEAFQRAQGWRGTEADGLPGPDTWRLLVTGTGKDVPAGSAGPSSNGVPGYPGRAAFRPGASNASVTQLGRRLVKKGFGRYYTSGPGPRWTESDRRATEAFQRAQGWRGSAADGYPGPETWRRLFS